MTRTITVIVVATGAAMLGLAAPSAGFAQSTSGAKTERRCDGVLGAVAPGACTRAHAHPGHAGVAGHIPLPDLFDDYPVPYKYEYPGRGYVRQCTSWLATENRVAGTVIMPQMRCWWQPGS